MKRLLSRLPRLGYPDGSIESWLASKDVAKRALADDVLRQIGEENAVTFLSATVKKEEHRRYRRAWCGMALVWVIYAAVECIVLHYPKPMRSFVWLNGTASFFGSLVFSYGVQSRLYEQCIDRLLEIDERRVFTALVMALTTTKHYKGDAVAIRLTSLLPDLETEDFATLSKAEQTRLFRYISPRYACSGVFDLAVRRELSHALLLTCARLGNNEALSATRKMARRFAIVKDESLQQVVRQCLPLLEQARADQKASGQQMVVRR